MMNQTFCDFMLQRFQSGGFTTDDMLTTILPLCRETVDTHEAGLVAPLNGTGDLYVSNGQAWFQEAARQEQKTNLATLSLLERHSRSRNQAVGFWPARTTGVSYHWKLV